MVGYWIPGYLTSFWFWWEKGFDLHMHVLLRVQYSCGGVLVIWFWREIVFGVTYILSVQYSCAVVSVFLLWRESFITTGKKSSSRLSGVCAIVITTKKKSSSRDFYTFNLY